MSPDPVSSTVSAAAGTLPQLKAESRIRLAGILVLVGLFVEAGSLAWRDPLAFVLFLAVGALLVAAGIALYLLTLVHVV